MHTTHITHTMASVMGAIPKLAQQRKTRSRGCARCTQKNIKDTVQSPHTFVVRSYRASLKKQAVPRVPCQNFEEDIGLRAPYKSKTTHGSCLWSTTNQCSPGHHEGSVLTTYSFTCLGTCLQVSFVYMPLNTLLDFHTSYMCLVFIAPLTLSLQQ